MAPLLTRRAVLGAGAGLAAALAGCAAPALPAGDDAPAADVRGWPQWRRDPGRTGYNPDAEDPAVGGERWVSRTGAGAGSPVVIGETVYVGSDAVYAFDAADGTERWRRSLPFRSRAAPAVEGETVYAASKFFYYAIAAGDGSDRWFASRDALRFHAPTVADGTLYLPATAFGGADFAARVVALDPGDGAVRWEADVGTNVLPPFAPAVADGTVYVGRDRVYALDANDGGERWTATAQGVSAFGDPVVADGTVYVGGVRPREGDSGGAVLALDADDGTERWRFETDRHLPSPAVTDDAVYVTADRVYALGAADGRERWTVADERYATASPAATDGAVYLAGADGSVLAVDARDGATRWRLPVATGWLAAPAAVGDAVYAASADGRVVAIGE